MGELDRGKGNRIAAEVRAYWEGLRNGRLVPTRSDVDPRGIERALEHAFLLERIAPGAARFRVAGMHLNDLMGMEVRGMPLTAFFTPTARKRISDILESAFNSPEVADLTLNAETGFGKPALQARLLILPMTSDLGDVNRALGCLIAEGAIGRSPRRFELAKAQISPIIAGSVIGRRQSPAATLRQTGLAEAPAHFAPALPTATPQMTPEARRAMLRLVRSDD
ncbi:PAS domain-containing protein [Phaeovulum sp.]|uniref:PAS domain-containing protein n=1 Tax=Phaeovulum sp. TaxID=2934796 RepID=UPI0039E409C5